MVGQARNRQQGLTETSPSPQKDPSDSAITKRLMAAGGMVGALAVSSCCVLPLVLFGLGVSGAWIGNLAALAPYQPLFVMATLGFLAAGFVAVYRRPRTACADGNSCASPASDRLVKIALWSATVLVSAALIFPYVAPLLLAI